jgi:hypothetical protein
MQILRKTHTTQDTDRSHAIKYGIATAEDVRNGLVGADHVSSTKDRNEIETYFFCHTNVLVPQEDSPASAGEMRLKLLQEKYPDKLIDVGVYEDLADAGLHNPGFDGLDHLKNLNCGEVLGPLLTFDGSRFSVTREEKFDNSVVGIRYDLKNNMFYRVVMSFEAFSSANLANTFALLYLRP